MNVMDGFDAFERNCRTLPSACTTSCIAACCMKGNVMELAPDEATYMQERGTGLLAIEKASFPRGYKLPKGKGAYQLTTDCGNLDPETRLCTDYENRPEICRDFKASNDEQSSCYATREFMRDRVDAGTVDLGIPVIPKFDAMVQDLNQTATWRTIC